MRGIKNIALVLTSQARSARSASTMARPAIRSLQIPKGVTRNAAPMIIPREVGRTAINHGVNDKQPREAVYMNIRKDNATGSCCKKCLAPSALEAGYCACYWTVGEKSASCACRTASEDSAVALLSKSRVMMGDLVTSLEVLRSLPDDALQAIRTIDLELDSDEAYDLAKGISAEWLEIVDIIKNKCVPNRLHLSIDMSNIDIEIGHALEEEPDLNEQIWGNVVRVLTPLRGLDRLEIYLSAASDEDEAAIEKAVMGNDYDAYARGKLRMSERDPESVHEIYEENED